MNSTNITISCKTIDSIIAFAADELRQTLEAMLPPSATIKLELGLISDFSEAKQPVQEDPEMDDAICIEVRNGTGIIAGINSRSVLLSTYRYLTELGCRWVRPGEDGAIIPKLQSIPDVSICESASYRHRGVCIEGAVSYEHVRDMIEWIPKLGFNGYFIQFREAHTFFERWYAHQGNPLFPGAPLSIEKAKEYTAMVARDMEKRGLIYHGVGHGWTCEPFGVPGLGWDNPEKETPESIRPYVAELNGERKYFGGLALNTNLCYSNPEARRKVIEEIANYSVKHPEIDIIHFWLADGCNNNCECSECQKARPSDFYVIMLNELDELLTARGLATKIVFLIYVDLLWPPESEKIVNQDRFILMFAPIVRTYSQAFPTGAQRPAFPPYNRNKLEFPKEVDVNVSFLKSWQDMFKGDSFDFDYHLMWDHYNDPGHILISDIISQDMKGLKKIGLNGYVSCQIQRIFLPTGLPMAVMGQTLWNTDADYQTITNDYCQNAFGPDWTECLDYLTKIGQLFDPVYLRGEKEQVSEEAAANFASVPALIDGFLPIIQRNQSISEPTQAKSWFYLKYHAQIYRALSEAFELRARGESEKVKPAWEIVKKMVQETEETIHPALDLFEFLMCFEGRLGLAEPPVETS